jgi:glycine betaine/choline ABC-type transport system substrate-binding protein
MPKIGGTYNVNANTLYQLQENLIIAALRRPALDAVDGSSTGTRVPWMWEPLKLP